MHQIIFTQLTLLYFLNKTRVQAIKHMMHKINTVLLCKHLRCHTTLHFGCDIIKNSNQSKIRCISLTLHATHCFSVGNTPPCCNDPKRALWYLLLIATNKILIATLTIWLQKVTLTQPKSPVVALNVLIATKLWVSVTP